MDINAINRFVLGLDSEHPFEIMINIPQLLLDFMNYTRSAGEFIDPFISQWQLCHIVGVREIKFTYADYVTIHILLNMVQSPEIACWNRWPKYHLWKRLDDPWWEFSSNPQ